MTLTLLMVGALGSSVAAQSKVITTIVPSNITPVESAGTFTTERNVTLTFQTPTLPPNAKVTKAILQLSVNDEMNSSDGAVRVIFVGVDKSEANFASRQFDLNTPGKDSPIQWVTTSVPSSLRDLSANSRGSTFALRLVPDTDPNPARRWYWQKAETRFLPRLILEYTVPNRPALLQTEGVPATHSVKAFMPGPAATAFGARGVSAMSSYAPVSFNGVLYIISTDSKLQALPALGGPPIWTQPLAGPGQHLLLSESGRIYIVGNGKILAYQLNTSNAATPPTEVKAAGGQALVPNTTSTLNPTVAPAVGADGSLYFVTDQKVYGLNPDLQELWNVTLQDKLTSRLTIGPGGQFVYLLGKKDGLMAIDARTGVASRAPLPNSDQLANSDQPTLHAPVVLLNSDGTEKIYAAANSKDSGTLAGFDNQKTGPIGPDDGQLAPTDDWTPLTGLFSQPTASYGQPWKIYFVQVNGTQGQLKSIDWLTGVVQSPGNVTVTSPYLVNGGNLALDQRGNLLVWDGKQATLNVFGPDTFASSPFRLTGVTVDSRLLFGSDGTLYAAGGNNLQAILPQFTLGSSPNADITSPTHLRVDGTASGTTKLTASGNVFLGSQENGFSVKSGSTLSIKRPPQ